MKLSAKTILLSTVSVLALLFWAGCDKDLSNADCDSVSSAYSADVKPLIIANCTAAGCHNAGSARGDFTTYAGLKAVADNGQLNQRVNERRDMPPSGSLSREDRLKIKCWITHGAPDN